MYNHYFWLFAILLDVSMNLLCNEKFVGLVKSILLEVIGLKSILIIVYTAHTVSIKPVKTNRYRLGEVLSKCSDHLLFLTATPHKGDSENFRLFLDLLEPGFQTSRLICITGNCMYQHVDYNHSVCNQIQPLLL